MSEKVTMGIRLFLIFILSFSLNSFSCEEELQSFTEECKIQDEYNELRSFYGQFGIDPDYLTGYRSLRFVKDEHWFARKDDFQCRPWEFYNPKPKTWLFWEKGAQFAEDLARQQHDNFELSKEFIQQLHLGAISNDLMGAAAKLKGNEAGEIRSSYLQLPPGFSVECDDYEIDDQTLELLRDYDLKDVNGDPLVSISTMGSLGINLDFWNSSCDFIEENGEAKTYHARVVKYMGSSGVEVELNRLIDYTNETLAAIKAGESEISPYEFLADVQRWYVSIHPFGDGNGRTSRYLQDILARQLGLPPVRSGFLQHDVFVSKDEYRKNTLEDAAVLIESLKACKNYYEQGLSYEQMPCECRPLYPEEELEGQKTMQPVRTETGECVNNPIPAPIAEISDFRDLMLYMVNQGIYTERDR